MPKADDERPRGQGAKDGGRRRRNPRRSLPFGAATFYALFAAWAGAIPQELLIRPRARNRRETREGLTSVKEEGNAEKLGSTEISKKEVITEISIEVI
jgi:hypothetical protein